jgi:hypothetical protein
MIIFGITELVSVIHNKGEYMKYAQGYLIGTGEMVYVFDSLKSKDINGNEKLEFVVEMAAGPNIGHVVLQPANNVRFSEAPPVFLGV